MIQTGGRIGAAALMALGLAVSASNTLAQANTSVQIYGIVDAGVEYLNGVADGGTKRTLFRLNPSNQVASRLGIRGKEDLGGGTSAVFNLENGFSPDTGTTLQNGRLFGRAAVVGLEGNWGSVLIGRQRNTIFDLTLIYDPMAYGTYGFTATDNAFFTQRPDNSIKYTFRQGPISASALYSFGRDALTGAPPGSQSEVPGASKIGRQVGANVNYAAGPLSVGIGYDQQHGVTAALQSEIDRRLFVGASYVISGTKLYAGFQRRNNDIPAIDLRSDLYWLGVKQALTSNLGFIASLSHTKEKHSPNKATLLGTSLYYDFSKRTQLYLNVGRSTNSGTSAQGVTGTTFALPGQNMTGIVTGVMHRF
ncbi:porin [Noviherbaspirillum saxi]|uniref:Porin n=1 Tax=Noviherbaspirillum saxi TaxID=2320863 RepID=A0A3A3FYU6_9BURK|nr:porin [Noviherbaspirillum saxi]RJF92269.1 porin [Noviherbaspirillum saxi]